MNSDVWSSIDPVTGKPTKIAVGAIRWDAWYDSDPADASATNRPYPTALQDVYNRTDVWVRAAVQGDLSPSIYAARRPSFATNDNAGNLVLDGTKPVLVDGVSMDEMTYEIITAQRAGIDYWAFDYYRSGDPMQTALDLYLADTAYNFKVKFSIIDAPTWNYDVEPYDPSTNQDVYTRALEKRAELLVLPNYQRVLGNRPLYYLYTTIEVQASSGTIDQAATTIKAAAIKDAVSRLRADVAASGIGDVGSPYVVLMGQRSNAQYLSAVGADAVSDYANADSSFSRDPDVLARQNVATWNDLAGAGGAIVPTDTTGFNVAPRLSNPNASWDDGTTQFDTATARQVGDGVAATLNWVQAHPTQTAGTALIYAWNEFDEGGYIAPTYVPGNASGDTSRLNAIRAAIDNDPLNWTAQPDGGHAATYSDGSQKRFSAEGVLTQVIAADDSSISYDAASETITYHTAAGVLLEDVTSDGTLRTYGADQTRSAFVEITQGALPGQDGTRSDFSSTGLATRVSFANGDFKLPYNQPAPSSPITEWLYFHHVGNDDIYFLHQVDRLDAAGNVSTIDFIDQNSALTERDDVAGRTVFTTDRQRVHYRPDGTEDRVTLADGSYKALWKPDEWLYFHPDGTYYLHEIISSDGSVFYDAAGKLVKIVDRTGVHVAKAPSHLGLQPTSDTGLLGDCLTTVANPVLSGRAEPGSVITVFDGLTVLGSAVATSSGVWAFASPTLSRGVHGITAVSVDPLGLTSPASDVLNLTIEPCAAAAADPLFDAAYYLAEHPDVAASGVDPYQHYLQTGWTLGYNPSAMFDGNFYLASNPDVLAAGFNPLQHYEAVGWIEGRAPSLLFSDAKYEAANPDVAAAHLDPLSHYLQFGQFEGRATFLTGGTASADPLIDAEYYDKQLGATLIPGGSSAAQQAAYGFSNGGWQAGLNPDAWFDTGYYLGHNPDVAAAGLDPLKHYEQFGWKEGRDPSPRFSTSHYLAAYSQAMPAGTNPLLDFVTFGQAAGRVASPV